MGLRVITDISKFIRLLCVGVRNRPVNIPAVNNTPNNAEASASNANNGVFSTLEVPESALPTSTTTQIEGNPVPVSSMELMPLDDSLVMAGAASKQDLQDFFAKPVLIADGAWAITDAPLAQLATLNMPEDAFSSAPVFREKTKGFLGFKATLVMKLQVNTAPQHAGQLILSALPMGQIDGMYPAMRFRSLRSISQLPNVQLDAASHSEVVLEVPYVGPFTHFNLVNNEGPIAMVRLHVLSQLATGTASTTVEWALWCSFKDVELVTPTYNAQMAQIKSSKKSKGKNITEAEAQNSGPISSVLGLGASVAGALVSVPALSAIAAPASWVFAAAAGLASAFGYSTPIVTTPVHRYSNLITPYSANYDGAVDNLPLSGSAENKVTTLPGFAGTDKDELSIANICSIPAYAETITLDPINTSKTLIYTKDLYPAMYATVTQLATGKTVDLTPMGFVASFFRYYRGSISLTFKFAKTAYHSGRLLVVFTPGNATVTFDQTAYTFREIIDLSEGNEWTIKFPYASTRPWRRTGNTDGGGGEQYGTVRIFVLNSLVSPDTVSPTADMLIFTHSEDVEFSVPEFDKKTPFTAGYLPQMAEIPSTSFKLNAGSAADMSKTLAPSQFCIGEKFSSLLQLLKMASYRGDFFLGSNSISGHRMASISCAQADITGFALGNSLVFDHYSNIASCFLLSRGGMRINIEPTVPTASDFRVVSLLTNTTITEIETVSLVYDDSLAGAPSIPFMGQGSISFMIPQYTLGHSRVNRMTTAIAPEPADAYGDLSRVRISNITGVNAIFRRAVADDCSIGYFIGVPEILYDFTTPAP